jgi:hypothetical protein
MSARVKLIMVGVICFFAGIIVVQNMPFAHAQQPEGKAPKWLHAFNLKARKDSEGNFTDTTKKYGVEVFRDENNNNLVYISETGSIAVVPGK